MKPRAAAARWAAAACALVVAAWAPAHVHAQAKKEPERREELQRLKSRIDKLQRELEKSEETRTEAADALRETEKSISEVNRNLAELAARRREIDRELADIARLAAANRADTRAQQDLLAGLLRHQYVHGNVDNLRLLLEGKDLATVERQMHYLGDVSKWRAQALEKLKRNAQQLAELEAGQRSRQQELDENAAAQRKSRAALQADKKARQQLLTRVKADIARNKKEIGRLKRDEDRLTRLIEQLSRAIATHRGERKRDSPAERVDEVADGALAGRAFESLKGRLKLPARGELRGRFGSPREEGGVTWKGLFIKTDTGQAVRAVADGQVVFADWVRGFGNLLVIDHGGAYMSVYGNNESLLKQVGDKATSGENVATAGSTGGALETGVYFELRHEGKPFDPMRWVGR
ncbi:MAG: peptidoglycan DD-metalloendopeptidase family protein [Betaproteobacteria bacterium]|nr:peptidoglycan DD-metalloendopeptidase family protein [Betaproteobacteria bacterium]